MDKPLPVRQELTSSAPAPARILTSLLALTPGTRLGVYEVTARIGVRRTESGFAERIARVAWINGFELIVRFGNDAPDERQSSALFGCQVERGARV